MSWSPTSHTRKLGFSYSTVSCLESMILRIVTVFARFEYAKFSESWNLAAPFIDLLGHPIAVHWMGCGFHCLLGCSTPAVLMTCCLGTVVREMAPVPCQGISRIPRLTRPPCSCLVELWHVVKWIGPASLRKGTSVPKVSLPGPV